ncbi:MAG: Uma2 family endonuclease [Armatimonadetes bacterium]|nr:Uma2 family endonuclease [Armatimonadota bacterium]
MVVEADRHLFDVEDYYRMARPGVLREGDRVELIEGEVLESPIGSRHAACAKRLVALFGPALSGGAVMSVQDPIRLSDFSEPQPDIALLKPRPDFYASIHPGPEAILLVVEVAGTSIEYDRHIKIPLYSRHGLPEAWLIDLNRMTIEVCWQPGAERYQSVRVCGHKEPVFSISGLKNTNYPGARKSEDRREASAPGKDRRT